MKRISFAAGKNRLSGSHSVLSGVCNGCICA
jgi:hypothetical protein